MGYLLLSPSPSPPLAFRHRSPGRHRARRGAAIVASSDGGPSPSAPSQAARYVLARRAVLLGVSALPLLRDTAAKAAAPGNGGLVTEIKDFPKVDEPQPGDAQAETPLQAPQPESPLPVATRHLSTSPCPQAAAAAKISCPRSGMRSTNINRMKSASMDSSRRALRTYSSKAIVEDEPSAAAQLAASGASYRNFLKNVRLVACGLSLIWAFTLYLAWSKPRRRPSNGRSGRRVHLTS